LLAVGNTGMAGAENSLISMPRAFLSDSNLFDVKPGLIPSRFPEVFQHGGKLQRILIQLHIPRCIIRFLPVGRKLISDERQGGMLPAVSILAAE